VVVISHPLLNDREASIDKIFHRMWSEKILEVVVVFRLFSNEHCNEDTHSCSLLTSDIQVASYNPFSNFKDINYITRTWSNSTDIKAFFPSLSDVNRYPLRIAMFPDPLSAVPVTGSDGRIQKFEGYDGHTVHCLAQYMNAVTVFVPQNDHTLFGTTDANGTLTGTCGDVAYGRADIASNSQYIKIGLIELEYTYPHDTNNLCFLVPKSTRIPQFRNLFLPFPDRVWLVLLCAVCLTSLCWYCVRKYGEISVKKRTRKFAINEAFFDIFRSFITGTVNELPASVLGRLFIVTWLLLAIIITNAFQGSLTSYLAVPKYLPEINTLKNLDKSGLGIFVSVGVKSYLALDENDKIMTNLWRKFIKHDRNFSAVCDRIARKRDVAGMFKDLSTRFYLSNNRYITDGHPMLHKVQEDILSVYSAYAVPRHPVSLQCIRSTNTSCPSTVHTQYQHILSVYSAYAVPRHSPFLPRFNAIIGRLFEAGLQRKWIGDTMHRSALDGKITPVSHPHASEPVPLGLTHLQTAFYLLLIGLLCSTLVFVLQHIMQVL
jgi:hypothetical protein